MTAIRNMAYYRPFKKKNGGIGYRHYQRYQLQINPLCLPEMSLCRLYRGMKFSSARWHSYQNPYNQTILKKERFKMKDIRNMAYYRPVEEKCGGIGYRDVIIRHYQQIQETLSRLEKQKHLNNSACRNNSLFAELRIPPKGHKCTHLQRSPKKYSRTSIVSEDNQMDRLKSWSNLREIDPEINLMHAPPLDLSSLIASNSSLQDTPQTSQDAEGVAHQGHSSVPQPKAPDQLPVPQKIACQSFGDVSSSNSNDRVSTDNHNNRHLSSSSDQRKGIGPVHDAHITSEKSQFQSALRQSPIARPVCVSDPDYTLHTIDSATSSRHAPQPEHRSDRPLPQVLGIDNLPSVNLTNWFSSQQPLTSEGTAAQPQPIPTRVSMDQIPLESSWNDVQKPFELFSSGKDESIFVETTIKQPFLFWRNTSKTSELNHALARAA